MNEDKSAPDSPEPNTDETEQLTPSPKKLAKIKKLNVFAGKEKYEIIVIVVLMLVVGGASFYFGKLSKHTKSDSTKAVTQVAVASKTASPSTAPKLPDAQFLSGNTYLDSPKKLGDLGFIKDYKALGCVDSCDPSALNIAYYQVGNTAKSQRVLAMTYFAGPGGDGYVYAIETKAGAYSLLAQNDYDPGNFATNWQPSLSSNTTIDEATKIDDIKMPLQATIAGQKIKVLYAKDGETGLSISDMSLMRNGLTSIRGDGADTNTSDIKKLGSQDNIDYYEAVASDTANYKVVELHGAYKQLYSGYYTPAGEIANTTGDLNINWTSGVSNKNSYFSTGQGCGSSGYVIAKNVESSDLIKVGTTPQGQAVYQLPQSNPLVQEIYTKDYNAGEFVDSASLKNLSVGDFTKQHGYFIAVNGLNENVLFLRSDIIIHGGCAKPVVYLYPQQKEQVSVKVGAQVVNSLPAYNDGWENVTAYPDGSLTYKDKVYSNLFWDGYGYGTYPDINSGTIVPAKNVVGVVKQQLAQQGLNAQEISDFLSYWQPKLIAINQPYIRLTWLNTAQMNSLAPLQITPQPHTLIRVFLDFEGISKPYNLAPQKLWAPARQGFTVTEWGGLARQGL